MAYCVEADILKQITEEQLIQLTDDEDTGAVVDDIVDDAIAAADAIIDGYCGKRYTVPFTTTPPVVNEISVTIAIYKLYSRRSHAMPELRKEQYNNVIKMLQDIEAGKISLGVPAPSENSGRAGSYQGNTRLFTRDNMNGF